MILINQCGGYRAIKHDVTLPECQSTKTESREPHVSTEKVCLKYLQSPSAIATWYGMVKTASSQVYRRTASNPEIILPIGTRNTVRAPHVKLRKSIFVPNFALDLRDERKRTKRANSTCCSNGFLWEGGYTLHTGVPFCSPKCFPLQSEPKRKQAQQPRSNPTYIPLSLSHPERERD